ncbi:MAG: chemotaxis protein CheW [Christensenellales bacterium]|jgi:purine-binding chemotaxis protein CheW
MLDVAAQELDNLVSDAQKNQYLIFALGPNHYGIDIKNVTEIIGIQKITKVPELPEYVQGIISLRGKIIPVVDVRMRFKIEAVEYNDRTCIIIVDLGNVSVGLIVDGVADVLSFEDSEIVDTPGIEGDQNKFVKGVGKVGDEVKLLINCEKLLNDEDTDRLSEVRL